jgi:hypothetical protein
VTIDSRCDLDATECEAVSRTSRSCYISKKNEWLYMFKSELYTHNAMGDPLGTAAAIVGIVAGTLHASRLVYDDIRAIAEAPDIIVQLRSDLDGLYQNL